jgi:hypothetical protein
MKSISVIDVTHSDGSLRASYGATHGILYTTLTIMTTRLGATLEVTMLARLTSVQLTQLSDSGLGPL